MTLCKHMFLTLAHGHPPPCAAHIKAQFAIRPEPKSILLSVSTEPTRQCQRACHVLQARDLVVREIAFLAIGNA
jgi:hypothetical protein